MTCSFNLFGFLFGTNIINLGFLFYFTLWNPTSPLVTNLDFPTTYNVLHNTNWPNIYKNNELYYKFKQVEIVEHGLH